MSTYKACFPIAEIYKNKYTIAFIITIIIITALGFIKTLFMPTFLRFVFVQNNLQLHVCNFCLKSTFCKQYVGRFIFYLMPHFQVSGSNGSISNNNKTES